MSSAKKKPSGKSNKGSEKAVKRKVAPKRPPVNLGAGKARLGHNSGKINAPLAKIFKSYEDLEENKRQISKAQRDLRAKAKEEHGVQSNVFNQEVKLRKMDSDVRVQFEQGCMDLKSMLGYQFDLNLAPPDDDDNGDEQEKEVKAEEKDPEDETEAKEEVEDSEDSETEGEQKRPSFLHRHLAASEATH